MSHMSEAHAVLGADPSQGPTADDGKALYAQLAAPFAASALEWRVGSSGKKDGTPWAKVLVYIDARACRARLNDVCGPANWRVSYGNGPADGIVATLAIRIGGEWIEKQDGAGLTDVEPTKGGISDAFKRVCAVWGIGEYLYDADDSWATFTEDGRYNANVKADKTDKVGTWYKWNPPILKINGVPAFSGSVARSNPPAARPTPAARSSAPPSQAAPSAGAVNGVQDWGATIMPFGKPHIKGQRMGDLPIAEIVSALTWVRTYGKKYPAFELAASELIKADTARTANVATDPDREHEFGDQGGYYGGDGESPFGPEEF